MQRWGILSTPLALAAGTDFAREEIQRIPGTLLEQVANMNVGSIEWNTGNDFTITWRDGSYYVFENVAQDASGAASATVCTYDSEGTWTYTSGVDTITAVDANRVDFKGQITPAGKSDATQIMGSLTGLRSTEYAAVGSVNWNGESVGVMVDYSGVADSAEASSVIGSLATLTSIDADDSGIQKAISEAVLLLVIVIVVVVFVAATCFLFGWWGCD